MASLKHLHKKRNSASSRQQILKGIILVCSIFISSIVYGQTDFRPGYYITWENDTVYGLIDFRGAKRNSDHCLFKATEKSDPIRFTPDEISGYRFIDDKYYVSKKVEINNKEKQVFLEFLVNGITDIFFYSGDEHPRYFIESSNGKLIELSNEMKDEYINGKHIKRRSLKYMGVLKATLNDCKEIQTDIEHAELNHKSLINLGKKYHNYVCSDQECIIYEKPVPALKFKISPFAGMNSVKLSFPEDNMGRPSYIDFDFETAFTPSVGLVVNASVPQLSNRLSVDFGSSFYRFKTHSLYESIGEFHDLYDANIELTSLQTFIALKYTFPKSKVTPMFAVGFASNFFLSKSQDMFMESYYKGELSNSREISNYFPIITDLHGLYLELGTNFKIRNRDLFYTNFKLNYLGNFKGNYGNEDINGIKTTLITSTISFGIYLNTKGK